MISVITCDRDDRDQRDDSDRGDDSDLSVDSDFSSVTKVSSVSSVDTPPREYGSRYCSPVLYHRVRERENREHPLGSERGADFADNANNNH